MQPGFTVVTNYLYPVPTLESASGCATFATLQSSVTPEMLQWITLRLNGTDPLKATFLCSGQPVTIRGTNFIPSLTRVTIGNTECSKVLVRNLTTLGLSSTVHSTLTLVLFVLFQNACILHHRDFFLQFKSRSAEATQPLRPHHFNWSPLLSRSFLALMAVRIRFSTPQEQLNRFDQHCLALRRCPL